MKASSTSLVKDRAQPPKGAAWLNLRVEFVCTLVQMRQSMSEDPLEDLSRSIKEQSQLNPAIVVALNEVQATEYLRRINKMWAAHYRLKSFTSVYVTEKRERFYFFLVAGHRRLRAVKLAKMSQLYSLVHFDMSFTEAILLQYHENVHKEVSPEHVARFLGLLWRTSQESEEKPTVAKFAKKMGMTAEAVRKAVRFTSLPVEIQALVMPTKEHKKGIAYGLLCELARLNDAHRKHNKPLKATDLMSLAYTIVAEYRTIKDAAGFVSERIKFLEGQGELVGFELSVQDVAKQTQVRVETQLESTVKAGHAHLKAVSRFYKGKRVSSTLSGSAVTATVQACDTILKDAPSILGSFKGSRTAKKAERALLQILTPL